MTLASLNCSAADVDIVDMCNYLVAANTPLECAGPLSYKDVVDGVLTCFNYTSPEQKMAMQLGDQSVIDTGNTAWMLLASALVMIMTPGVGLFYAGLAGEETAGNTLLMSFACMGVVTLQWFLFGYSFAFGPGTEGFGSFQWGGLFQITEKPSGVYGWQIPHLCWMIFQCMFAQITPALISGALIGRMKFSSFLIFVFVWTTVIYDPLAHWLWSWQVDPTNGAAIPLGWLNAKGAIDFAGGAVIHVSSGFAALAAALVLGKRYNHKSELKPHNVPMVITGASLLWFGWFGFNAGSAGGSANVGGVSNPLLSSTTFLNGLASQAFLNTHNAAASATISWLVVEKIFTKKVTATGAAAGCVAGLVAITPACGFVDLWAALCIGVIVSPICFLALKFKSLVGIDDTLDSFAIHGIGGYVGAICTGLWATKNVNTFDGAFYGNPDLLGWEVAAVTVSATFSFIGTFLILMIMKKTIGIRIDDEQEREGIDLSEHGGKSYAH